MSKFDYPGVVQGGLFHAILSLGMAGSHKAIPATDSMARPLASEHLVGCSKNLMPRLCIAGYVRTCVVLTHK